MSQGINLIDVAEMYPDDFLYGEGVTIIEWGELLDESLLGDYLLISISHHGDGRQLLFESFGPRSKEIQEEMING